MAIDSLGLLSTRLSTPSLPPLATLSTRAAGAQAAQVPEEFEHYQRDRVTLQRVHWSAPRPRIVAAIEATVQLAKAAEAEAADTSFHKKEFPS